MRLFSWPDGHNRCHSDPIALMRIFFDSPSAPQEADSIGPFPFRGLPGEVAQGSYETASIRWRDGLFVNENHPAVPSLFFRPGFEQRGNRPSIVGNERQPLRGRLLQTGGVLLT